MSERHASGPEADGVELLADAEERFAAGDSFRAARLLSAGRRLVTDPEALAEADALQARLDVDRAPVIYGLVCFGFWLAVLLRTVLG